MAHALPHMIIAELALAATVAAMYLAFKVARSVQVARRRERWNELVLAALTVHLEEVYAWYAMPLQPAPEAERATMEALHL